MRFSTHNTILRACAWAAIGGLIASCAGQATAADPVVRLSLGDAKTRNLAVHTFDAPSGEAFSAIAVRAKDTPARKDAIDHVVLVDTSASQVGEHRRQALAVVEEFLSRLPATDRVEVMAVDLAAQSLTDGLVAADSKEVAKALKSLKRRLPLGATNLEAAMKSAMAALEGSKAGSVLYIGDGMSAASLLESNGVKDLADELAQRRVPVHSYGVGPRKDLELLGVLAQRTGGLVLFDVVGKVSDAPETVAARLATAVHKPVYYPEQIAVTPVIDRLPNTVLPLRSDRSTIFLAKGKLGASVRVTVTGSQPEMQFTAAQKEFETGNTYLATLWERAEQNQGLNVAFAGNSMLRAAQGAFDNQVANLVEAGKLAVASKNHQQAERIGLLVQKADPTNPNATILLNSAKKLRTELAMFQQPAGNQPAPAPANDPAAEVEQLLKIRTERLALEVNRTVEQARNIARNAPDEAIDLVKRQLLNVQDAQEILPEAKQQMLKRLQSVNLELQNLKTRSDQELQRAAEQQAAIEAQQRLVQLARDEEAELEQLIDRVASLMDEGAHGDDNAFEEAEAVGRAAVDVRPGNGPATAALFSAEAAGQLNKAFRLRELRADRFLETLYQVELSHVPFPDEPPIRWPSAEVWKALTERRKKWASVDLHQSSPAEERIQSALIDPQGVDIEFVDVPLKDAMSFLADAHQITIIIDEAGLSEEGIAPDEPVNQILSGITLRSALKIILEPLGLTYVIEDEVMKITTIVKAEEKVQTRVYPVGDLVIPIVTPLAGGIGQGFGGVGGFGGQGGFGGGGQFGQGAQGFGGLGGGGLGGGGGGGFFSVPPSMKSNAKIPQQGIAPKANRPRARRRQIRDDETRQLLNNILKGDKTSSTKFRGQFFAQIRDPEGERFDNSAVKKALKKKA